MLKNITFLTLIFKGFGPRFGRVLGSFLGVETRLKRKKLNLEKPYETLAMGTKSRVGLSKFHPKIVGEP